jgi:hypothetical protein
MPLSALDDRAQDNLHRTRTSEAPELDLRIRCVLPFSESPESDPVHVKGGNEPGAAIRPDPPAS